MRLNLSVVRGGAQLGTSVRARPRLSTGCRGLDALMGGGFVRGELVEVFGPPASGRTQLALCVAAHALVAGSSVIYVDADGGLVPSRARELVAAASGAAAAAASGDGDAAPVPDADVDSCLERLLHCRVCSWDELAGGVAHVLPRAVREAGDVALVVVDSVALPYRSCERQGAQKRLEAFAGRMADLAMRHDVSVVLVNNSRLVDNQGVSPRAGGDSYMYPPAVAREVGLAAMGDAWAHVCPSRLAVGWSRDRRRVAHLLKSSRMPRARVEFRITSSGLEDGGDGGSDRADCWPGAHRAVQ
jgi:RecA/RadA recombinase